MSYTEEEKYDHDRSYFLARVFQALASKILTSQDMVDILKIVSNREDAIAKPYVLDKRKAVIVGITDEELQHVGYSQEACGYEK